MMCARVWRGGLVGWASVLVWRGCAGELKHALAPVVGGISDEQPPREVVRQWTEQQVCSPPAPPHPSLPLPFCISVSLSPSLSSLRTPLSPLLFTGSVHISSVNPSSASHAPEVDVFGLRDAFVLTNVCSHALL